MLRRVELAQGVSAMRGPGAIHVFSIGPALAKPVPHAVECKPSISTDCRCHHAVSATQSDTPAKRPWLPRGLVLCPSSSWATAWRVSPFCRFYGPESLQRLVRGNVGELVFGAGVDEVAVAQAVREVGELASQPG